MKRLDKRAKFTAAKGWFGATAAGSADLKGSAEIPPLRQAAIPLGASGESAVDRVAEIVKTRLLNPTLRNIFLIF
jgi:hypothetical protein